MKGSFLSPACVCEWRLIALPGVIKAEWTSGFVQWHGSHFMALPYGQWLCFIIVPFHCAALNGPSCHLSSIQCYPAWEWHFYTVRATDDKLLTTYLKYNTHNTQLLKPTQLSMTLVVGRCCYIWHIYCIGKLKLQQIDSENRQFHTFWVVSLQLSH